MENEFFSRKCFDNNNIFLSIYTPTSSHLYPLQVENCDSNSRFVVDGDKNNKFRLDLGLNLRLNLGNFVLQGELK